MIQFNGSKNLYIHIIFLLLIKAVPNHLKDEHGCSVESLSLGEWEYWGGEGKCIKLN